VNHFSITDWADFVRDVATREQTAQMQKHLDEGCNGCTETVQTWKSVKEYARQEVSYEPPSSSLRLAKSYFAPFKLASKQASGIQIARLSFDSFAGQVQVGVRGTDQLPRQLMYEYDDIFIDLRVEPKVASNEVLLVGQIADAGHPSGSGEGIPVSLLSGSIPLLQTSANQSGEFRFSFRPSKHLQLSIGLKETAFLLSLPDAEA
jgi:hypothetical protein